MSTVAYHAWWPVPQRRAALRGAATGQMGYQGVVELMPQRRAALRGAATRELPHVLLVRHRLNEGLLSEEQRPRPARRLAAFTLPQRRAALRGAAT